MIISVSVIGVSPLSVKMYATPPQAPPELRYVNTIPPKIEDEAPTTSYTACDKDDNNAPAVDVVPLTAVLCTCPLFYTPSSNRFKRL